MKTSYRFKKQSWGLVEFFRPLCSQFAFIAPAQPRHIITGTKDSRLLETLLRPSSVVLCTFCPSRTTNTRRVQLASRYNFIRGLICGLICTVSFKTVTCISSLIILIKYSFPFIFLLLKAERLCLSKIVFNL